jgi:hypothetical protein
MADGENNAFDNEAEVEEAMDKATFACQLASGVVPVPGQWGAWMYSDAHPAMGGGVGGFVWFQTRDEMLAFFREHLAYLDPGIQARNNAADIAAACQAVVDAVTDGSLELRVGMTRLNHLVRGLTVIQWWGCLEDLHTSDAAFPCEVRSRYRNDILNVKGDSSELPQQEHSQFAEFLSSMI